MGNFHTRNIARCRKPLLVYHKLTLEKAPFLIISRKGDEIIISFDTEKTSVYGNIFEQISWNLNGKNETQLIDFIQLLVARKTSNTDNTHIFIGTNFGFPDTEYESTNSSITTKLVRVIINSFSNSIGTPHSKIVSQGTF
jgi:hypothetical protein